MMRREAVWLVLVGGLVAGAVVSAGEPDTAVAWPAEWRAFGPVPSHASDSMYGFPPKPEDFPAADTLGSVPSELVIAGRTFKPFAVTFTNGVVDFGSLFNRVGRGMGVHLWAVVEAAEDVTVRVGAGADWWMRWHLDGRVVFDTLGRGILGNGSFPVTARDHEYDLALSKGRHIVAVTLIGGNRGCVLAVTPPAELRARPAGFRDAMAAGRRKYGRPHWSIPLDFAGARSDFERALEGASTDVERAEARLALVENLLRDALGGSGAEPIRRHCEAVLALPGAGAEQRARAALGLGEALLIEDRCASARAEFEKAAGLTTNAAYTQEAAIGAARTYLQAGDYETARNRFAGLLDGGGLDPLMQFRARSLLAAAETAPRIRPDHPRLFFNAESWPRLKARIEGDGTALSKLKKAVANVPGPTSPEYADASRCAGLYRAYLGGIAMQHRVTGEPAALETFRRLLRVVLDQCLERNQFNYHNPNWDLTTGLDWAWDSLPASDRAALARDLLRYAYSTHAEDLIIRNRKITYYCHQYEGAMYWYVGLLLANSGLTGAENARALELLGRGYYNHLLGPGAIPDRIIRSRGGGSWWATLDYALSAYQFPFWAFMQCWQSALGGTVPDEWAYVGLSPEFALRIVMDIRDGNPRQCIRWSGYSRAWRPAGGWSGHGENIYSGLTRFIHIFGKTHPRDAAVAAHLRGRLARAGCTGDWMSSIEPLLLDVPPPADAPLPEGLPLARHYPGNGLALMSSGFGPGHTYVFFSCGRWDPDGKLGDCSEHYDTGHFTIFKRGYLALDSGTRALGENAIRKGNSGANYDSQSVAHNTVLIRMPDEPFGPNIEANPGGQRLRPHYARPLAFESAPHYAYIAVDATGTYHSNKCARMVRQFLFLAPDHFVVFDRVAATRADYSKTWLLHTANEPVIAGREFRADQEQGRIFCRTLLPADAVLEPVGGPGREFWADGKNYPVPPDSTYLKSLGMSNAADVAENMGRWRVEVKPGAARSEDCFLNLIQVGDETLERMVESHMTEGDGRVRLAFSVGPRAYDIILNQEGEIGGHVRIEEGGRALADQDLAQEMPPDPLGLSAPSGDSPSLRAVPTITEGITTRGER